MAGVCLIVGAGPGIGRALALAFAREGYDIALAARYTEKLTPILSDVVSQTGRQARAYLVDASSERSIAQLVDAVRSELGVVEVAIYNAASITHATPTLLSLDALSADLRVNVGGALAMAQQVTPGMREAGRGTILFTGGGFALEPSAVWASLGMGKAALRNLTYALAQELGKDGIHVATVTVHGFVQAGTQFDPTQIAKVYVDLHRQPQGRFDIERNYK